MKSVLDFNLNFIQCQTNVIEAIIGIGANGVKHYFKGRPFPRISEFSCQIKNQPLRFGRIRIELKAHGSQEWTGIRIKLPSPEGKT
jgi:hypothetical protein